MALTYDLREVKDFDKLDWDITQSLIFQTMSIGLHEITEDNADEFWLRIMLTARLFGYPAVATRDEVWERVGLKTNAFPSKTREEWLKSDVVRLADSVMNDIMYLEERDGKDI